MKRLSLFIASLFFTAFVYAQDEEVVSDSPAEDVPVESTENAPAPAPVADDISVLRAEDNGGYNPLSRRPIHLSDQMYRKTIWRKLDLREKQNKSFFSSGNELSRILMDAVRSGKVTPYEVNDSLNRPISVEEFNKRIANPELVGSEEEDDGFGDGFGDEEEDGGWGDEVEEVVEEINPDYLPNQLYIFVIREDRIFDNQRSRMYEDILSIDMFVPADENIKGIEEKIASFRYVDLVEKVFSTDPRAVWYNPQNDAAHHTLQDALDLRLFSSYIVKVSNPDGLFLEDIYGSPEAGVRASYTTMYKLLEYEHNLWEY